MGNTGNLGILFRHALGGINDNNHDVRTLHRCHGADDAVAFQFFLNLALAAQAGRVDEHIGHAVINNFSVHRIPCGACDIAYNDPVLTEKLIDDGGFAHIGLAHNRNPWAVILFLFDLLPVKMLHHFIQQVSDSQPGGS